MMKLLYDVLDFLFLVLVMVAELLLNTVRGLFKIGYCHSLARLDGRTAIVSGGNRGIGKATARLLAQRGARVILACRDVESALAAASEIRSEVTKADISVMKLDLASMDSVRQFASNVVQTEQRVDILINNAGVFMCPYMETVEGFEMHFGVNYLGHFLLTLLLLDKIKQSDDGRIIYVSACCHFLGKIDFDDIASKKPCNRILNYERGQLARVMTTQELADRLGPNSAVKTYCVMPGFVNTDIGAEVIWMFPNSMQTLVTSIFSGLKALLFRGLEEGGQTSLYCAIDKQAGQETGLYYADCAVARKSFTAWNRELSSTLWEKSCQWVGLDEFSDFGKQQTKI